MPRYRVEFSTVIELDTDTPDAAEREALKILEHYPLDTYDFHTAVNEVEPEYRPVKLYDLPGINTADDDRCGYIAYSPVDCRCDLDKEVFLLVQRHGTTITMGKTIGEPL